jgi:sugar phosphate isomerase/epimerase
VKPSRRDFIKTGSATVICGSALLQSRELQAKTLNLPLGLQLYSVRDLLPKDYQGTLKAIGELGYREVESAGYFNHSAAEVKQAMDAAKLKLVSAHYPLESLHKQFDEILSFSKQVGVGHIVCSSPSHKDPSRVKAMKPQDHMHAFTLEDWHWNAEQLNALGEKVHAAGLKFGYHNHFTEFHVTDGVVPYAELMRLTDPAKVTMEMDCGWVVVGGGDPVEYLRKYPSRITMLHVKDFKRKDASAASEPVIAELGRGSIDYRPIFEEAAKAGHLTHVFAEQEAFTVPPMESLKIDADYLRKLGLG